MLVRVLSSCTGDKSVHPPDQLTLASFRAGRAHVREREADLPLTAAADLYTGQAHLPLVEGVRALREAGHHVDWRILSAGYGLVHEREALAPYDATYDGMSRAALRKWAADQGVPEAVRAFLEQPADLALVLLGNPYLLACQLPTSLHPGAPTLFVVGQSGLAHLPSHPQVVPVVHAVADTRRFGTALVGIKGHIARRLLVALAEDPGWLARAREHGLLDALAAR